MPERRGPIVAGLILIIIGGGFLARELIPGLDLSRIWPVASVIMGIALVVLSIRRAPPGPPAAG
jgi:hypothetical protein